MLSGDRALLRVQNLTRDRDGRHVVDDVTFSTHPHQLTVVVGESGAGKSSLVHCASGLDVPSSGNVWFGDFELTGASTKRIRSFRRQRFGYVFQHPNLLPGHSVHANVTAVHEAVGSRVDPDRLRHGAELLGIDNLIRHDRYPQTLSGGEQQRVAFLRAIAHSPAVVFADEPAAALDHENKHRLFRSLRRMIDTGTVAMAVVVSHDDVALDYADQVIRMRDGRIIEQTGAKT